MLATLVCSILTKDVVLSVELQDIFNALADVIVFPSIMHHRVNPILSGERKVLVAWAWGPLFK